MNTITVSGKTYFDGGSHFDSLAEIYEVYGEMVAAGIIDSFSVAELTESEFNNLAGYIE